MSDIENQETAAFNFKQKAEIYLDQGKLDVAYATCLKALEILPNCGEIHHTLGNVMQKMGKLESAKNCYLKAIADNHNLAQSYANLGTISAIQQQWEQAIKYYEKAIDIKPNTVGFYRNLAKIWQRLGNHELVTECNYKALILEPTLPPVKEYLSLGDKLLELDKAEEAITILNQGIKLHPNFALFYYYLGEALTKTQRRMEAALAYRRAVELKPDNYFFHGKLEGFQQQQYQLKETGETNFNQFRKAINFTIIPAPSGFTDQLLQFMMFYKLGLSLGYKYIHTDFYSNRSSQKVYNFLGFNRYWCVNIKNIDLQNYSLIYLRFDNDNLDELKSMKSLKELQQYCNNFLEQYNYAQKNPIVIFRLQGISRSRVELLSLINSEIASYQDNLSLRNIYFEYTQNQVKTKKIFTPEKIKLLIHIRAGDIAHIKTPWGFFIKSIKRLQDESKKFDKDLNRINCFVNQVNSLDVNDYYQFAKDFIYCLGKQNISTVVFSDGYKRTFDFIQKNIQQMKLTTEETREIFKLSNSYESKEFCRFNNLQNCTCIIGESDEKLFDLIRSCMIADIFIIGSEQRMIPKFIANYYDIERPPIIFILYKNRDLSSIMKTHFEDLRLDSWKVTMIPVDLDSYQISDLVSVVKNQMNFIESSSL